VLDRAERLGVPARRHRALDVGCGLGRSTRALAPSFTTVCGVDVSRPLVLAARRLNHDLTNLSFTLSPGSDLRQFDTGAFDLVHSMLVLQHLPDSASIRSYIAEFVRVTAVRGLVVFQLPQHVPVPRRVQPRRRAYRLLRGLGMNPQTLYGRLGLDPMQVRAMPRDRVVTALRHAGAEVLAVEPDNLAAAFPSATYYASPTGEGRALPR
jgi:SAM-dependent methyltransferase